MADPHATQDRAAVAIAKMTEAFTEAMRRENEAKAKFMREFVAAYRKATR